MLVSGRLVGLDQRVEIEVIEGIFSTITKVKENGFGSQGVFIAPPLIDVQVNGFAGYDLNSNDVTVEDV